jgi:hypothetical protein
MTPAVTDQTLPLPSMIFVAEGMVVPLAEAVEAAMAVEASATAVAFKTVAAVELSDEDVEPAVLSPPQAASAKHEAATAALKMLIVRRIETLLCRGRETEFRLPSSALFSDSAYGSRTVSRRLQVVGKGQKRAV